MEGGEGFFEPCDTPLGDLRYTKTIEMRSYHGVVVEHFIKY